MSEMNRREALTLIALAPLATAMGAGSAQAQGGIPTARQLAIQGELKFFTPAEFATVKVLADLVIPADERSGSATDAAAPEFMDFMLADQGSESAKVAMRGGLAWLDNESRERYGKPFIEASTSQQTAILDDIAWPDRARPEMSHGVAFFNQFRDRVASAFFSSKMGVEDLRYLGNTVVPEWKGCPPEALRKLNVSYDQWDRRYG